MMSRIMYLGIAVSSVLQSCPTVCPQETDPPELLWFQRFGGAEADAGFALNEVVDEGGLVIAGSTEGFRGRGDGYLLRLAPSGDVMWEVRLGTGNARAAAVAVTDDSFVVAGDSCLDRKNCLHLAIVSRAGEVVWERSFVDDLLDGSPVGEFAAVDITTASDGDVVVLGEISFTGEVSKIYVGKLSTAGEFEWELLLEEGERNRAGCIRRTRDGGYIVGGNTEASSPSDFFLTKLSAAGRIEWQRVYQGPANDVSVGELPTGFLISGWGGDGVRLFRTDSIGDIVWTRDVLENGPLLRGKVVSSGGARRLADHEYLLALTLFSDDDASRSPVVFLKFSESGELTWRKRFGDPGLNFIQAFDLMRDGGYAAVGNVTAGGGDVDIFVARLLPTVEGRFRRGDADGDGEVNLTDPILTLGRLFGGSDDFRCLQAADADDDGEVNLADPIFTLRHLFQAGMQPPAPFESCGIDFTLDALDCVGSESCRV